MKQIGLKKGALVVDLTRSKVVAGSLTETKIMCTAEDKVLTLDFQLWISS